MRVLYCTRSDSPHDRRFLTALGQSGHEVYALRLLGGKPLTPKGVTEVPWQAVSGSFRLSDLPGQLRQLRRLLANLQPDLVHAGPIQDLAFLVARAGFHPLLTMSWGFDLMKDAYQSPLLRWQTRYTLRRSDYLTLDCQATADRALAFGFPRERICVFPWGVDLDFFSPQNSVVPGKNWRAAQGWEEKTVLLCLRSWEPNYGVDVLARSFARAVLKNPQLRLILLSDGSEAKKIHALLKGVEDKVYFGGRVELSALPGWYGAADLYVSPSHVDGSSVSLLEAMACGLPSIVSDIPANLEWIQDGLNGWVFPDGDAEALTRAILAAAQQDWRACKLQARQDAVLKADWNNGVRKLLACYEDTAAFGKSRKL
ncbi:MAG: glycosyltransferase family 4 protein [Anaerolineaceae bacterium]